MIKIKYGVFGLFLMFCLCAGCGDSVYMEKAYEVDETESTFAETAGKESADAGSAAKAEDGSEAIKNVIEETGQEDKKLVIYICGAVEVPGVYELPADARVVQAIEAAGGLRADADTVSVNQARKLEDGEQIRILTREEAEAVQNNAAIEGMEASDQSAKVNINLTDEETLMTLPGIGQAKASAIIEYRETNGRFTSITEIMNISGIKESVFSKIEDKITV